MSKGERMELIQQTQIGLNQEALNEWIEYRAFKKKPLSQFALDKSMTFLLKYDEHHQQHIVDTAIMNDWQCLHHVDPPKIVVNSTKERTIEQDLLDTSWAE